MKVVTVMHHENNKFLKFLYKITLYSSMDELIDEKLQAIEQALLELAKDERDLLLKQKRLRCEKSHACSVMDLLDNVQIG